MNKWTEYEQNQLCNLCCRLCSFSLYTSLYRQWTRNSACKQHLFHMFFIVEWQYCYCNKCLINFWITWERNDDVLHTTAQILSISQIWLHPVPKLSSLQRVGINPCLVIHLSLVHQVPKISPATWCLKEVHLKLLHNQINYYVGCHCRSCPLTTPTHIEVGDNTTIW